MGNRVPATQEDPSEGPPTPLESIYPNDVCQFFQSYWKLAHVIKENRVLEISVYQCEHMPAEEVEAPLVCSPPSRSLRNRFTLMTCVNFFNLIENWHTLSRKTGFLRFRCTKVGFKPCTQNKFMHCCMDWFCARASKPILVHDMSWPMTCHDMTWHDRACHDRTSHDTYMSNYDMTGHVITWHDTAHDMSLHVMTWHDMIHSMTWHDM